MGRSKAIDILRAVAVILVLGRHLVLLFPEDVSPTLHLVTAVWQRGGWVGVDLFFVLSGFLVSGLLFKDHQKHGRISAKRFLVRRGFKIYPSFWLLILTTIAVGVVIHHPRDPSRVAAELLFVQNYRLGLWSHTWSLAVEEHFYIFLLILLLLLTRIRNSLNPFRLVPTAFAVLAFVCFALRVHNWRAAPTDFYTHFAQTHLRIDSLFAGVFVSYLYHYHSERFVRLVRPLRMVLLSLGVVLLAPAFIFALETSPFISTIGFSVFYVASACLMIGMLNIKLSDRSLPAALAYVGSHSYSIYLWHVPFMAWGIPLITGVPSANTNWYFYFAVYFGGSVCLGILMAAVIELPLLRARDRWFPSGGRPLDMPSEVNSEVAVDPGRA